MARAYLLAIFLFGCTAVVPPPVVVTDGPTCGAGTVLRGNQCVAVQAAAEVNQEIADEVAWLAEIEGQAETAAKLSTGLADLATKIEEIQTLT